jgi:tetratricopeptide (TPR) repeat protein
MRASGEGKQRLMALMSVVAVLVGGTALVGRLSRVRAMQEAPETNSVSPLSEERRTRLRELQALVRQLRTEARQEHWEKIVSLASAQEHRSGLVRALKAEALARLGRHDDAAAVIVDLYKRQNEPTLAILAGDFTAQESGVRHSIAEADSTPNMPGPALRAAWQATLSPRQVVKPDEVMRLAERGLALVQAMPTPGPGRGPFGSFGRLSNQPDRADALRVLGLALFRQERVKEALERFGEAERLRATPHSLPYQALCLRRLGRRGEADAMERRLETYLTRTFGGQARPPVYFLYLRELADARRAAGQPASLPRRSVNRSM